MYVNVPEPPVALTVAVPSSTIEHEAFVCASKEITGPVRPDTTTVAVPVHPLSSVTVTV